MTARNALPDEIAIGLNLLQQHRARFDGDVDAAKKLINYGDSVPDESLKPTELAAWTLIANLLLNLDEVVNKN